MREFSLCFLDTILISLATFVAFALRENLQIAEGLRTFTKVATVFMNAATAEQSCKALSLRLSGTPPRGAVYPTVV